MSMCQNKYQTHLILKINLELSSVGVSKGRIHRELMFILEMFSNLIKLDDKSRHKIGKNIDLERRLKDLSIK